MDNMGNYGNHLPWTAQKKANTFTLTSPQGYVATFLNGKISSLKINDETTLAIVHLSNGNVAVKEGTQQKLFINVPRNAVGEGSFLINGEKFLFNNDLTPYVYYQNQKPATLLLPRFSTILLQNGITKNYKFHSSVNKEIMFLDVQYGERKVHALAWEVKTGNFVSHNDYLYELNFKQDEREGFVIKRKNRNGQFEMYLRNNLKGFEERRELDGKKLYREWFLAGPAAGMVKCVIWTMPDGKRNELVNIYDDSGLLLRRISRSL